MKYYLDFEATQYSRKIISIGCVDETGRIFYSLVRPRSKKVITPFITKLTGLTWELLENAPTIDEAFSAFYDWVDCLHDAHFYVYGNEDKNFLRNSQSEMSDTKALTLASIIENNLIDSANFVKQKFHDNLALVTILAYYRNCPIISQAHNSLEDAKWLMELCDYMANDTKEYTFLETNDIKQRFPKPKVEYFDKKKIPEEDRIHLFVYRKIGKRVAEKPCMEFTSFEQAVKFICKDRARRNRPQESKKIVLQSIHRAIEEDNAYYHFKWKLEN